jgi:uncharacterized protein (DUF1800 family)
MKTISINKETISKDLVSNQNRQNLVSSLDEEQGLLTKRKALHLLRRISFGPTPDILEKILDRPISEVVDELLGDGLDYLDSNSDRLPEGRDNLNWIDTVEEDPSKVHVTLRGPIEGTHKNRHAQLKTWWLNQMKADNSTRNYDYTRERLTFFWHTHWAIEFSYDTQSYIPPPILYRSNQKLRKYRLGNFKDFVVEMTLDGAYLLYQGLNLSSGKNPNENYARELMELFTMGIGNYSEGDIREASRALTGWRVSAHRQDPKPFEFFDTYFSAKDHDLDSKQIMGETIAARAEEDNTLDKVREEEVLGLINILFNRRPNAISEFICTKIYSHFIYSSPGEYDEVFIKELAQVFIDNNFELLPVFRSLFKSKHFYSEENVGIQIKHPVELIAHLESIFNINYTNKNNALLDMEQELYDPPNVSGWPGYHSWISTKTYPRRVNQMGNLLNTKQLPDWFNVLDKFSNPTNFNAINQEIVEYLLPKVSTEERLASIVNRAKSNSGFNSSSWEQLYNSKNESCINYINELLKEISKLPDINLS